MFIDCATRQVDGQGDRLRMHDVEQYFGYEETRRSSQIALVAEVASAYLVIAADRAILKVTQETLTARRATLDLISRSLDAGTSTAIALRQAKITVDTTRADLALYTRQLEQDRNILALLIGGTTTALSVSVLGREFALRFTGAVLQASTCRSQFV